MTPLVLAGALSDIDSFEKTLDWRPFRPGIEIATVYEVPGGGSKMAFLKYGPGASAPHHAHEGHEHIFILKGSQVDPSGEHGAGSVVVNRPGSSHDVHAPNGCIVLIVWEKPVVFTSP